MTRRLTAADFQGEGMASDVNCLKAVDFSRAVEAHPKEKPSVREIRTVVDEFFVTSLLEKR
jgi:hypothetical protein